MTEQKQKRKPRKYTDEFKKLGIEVEENIKLLNSTNPNIETIRKTIVPTQFCQVKSNTGFAPDFGAVHQKSKDERKKN